MDVSSYIGVIRVKKRKVPKKKANPVAKNMEKFNRPATHKDKKKESKINGEYYDE